MCFWVPIRLSKQHSPQDHSGVAGGGTRRVGVKFEVASPKQVWRAGGDTFTPSTAGQVPNLSLDPTSSQDVFWGADSPK